MTNMQVLPVANMGYLCPSLWWAEYELYRRKKEKEIEGCKMRNAVGVHSCYLLTGIPNVCLGTSCTPYVVSLIGTEIRCMAES